MTSDSNPDEPNARDTADAPTTPDAPARRQWERLEYQTEVLLQLESGKSLAGRTNDVSLGGLFLALDDPADPPAIGDRGILHVIPNQDGLKFPCEVVRITETGCGVNFSDKQAAFGIFVTHDMLLTLLTGINESFATSLDIEKTLKNSVNCIKDHLLSEAASLFLLEDDDSTLVCRACSGPVDVTGMRLAADEGIVGRVVQNKTALIVHDVANDSRFAKRVDEATGFKTESILCAPLILGNRVLGALEVLNKRGSGLFAGHDRIVLTALASTTALAIHNAQQSDSLLSVTNQKNVALTREVEEQEKSLARELKFQDTILQTIADAVITIDGKGNIISFNAAAEKQFGYTKDEILNQPLSILLPKGDRSHHDEQLAHSKLITPRVIQRQNGEMLAQRKDGSTFHVELNIAPIQTQNGTGFVGSMRDVTQQKEYEQNLYKAKVAAEHANRAKSDFLSSMSHELRTPLNAILGFGQLLATDTEDPLSSDQNESIQEIINSGQHLLELINQVLDLAKIESGRAPLSIETTALSNILANPVKMAQTLAAKRNITLTDNSSDFSEQLLRVDTTRARQAVLNFLTNAIKYNHEGGHVTLEVSENKPGHLRIAVIDDGIGIPDGLQDKVFMPFSRLGQENSAVEGTGIGLSITKELVEMMAGHIGFESEAEKGSIFWMELPLADETTIMPEKKGEGVTVLYVEDTPSYIKLMAGILKAYTGATLISAANAKDGILLAAERQPDLIFMDINLPDIDGYQALRHLRESDKTKDIPVMAISAQALPDEVQKGLDAGFNDYLTKPFQTDRIKDVIEKIAAKKSLQA